MLRQVDFLIVGAGPIGSALALSLSEIYRGASVVLVDQSPQQSLDISDKVYDTKVFAINAGSRQLLQDIGVWEEICQQRVCPYTRMHVWDSEGTGSLSFSVDEFSTAEVPVSELGFIVEAGIIQQTLDQKISATDNIDVYRPCQITEISWQGSETHVQLSSGEQRVAQLVCAADGARSALRDIAGIQVAEQDCQQRALVANVELTQEHEYCAWQIFLPTGPLAFLPLQSSCKRYCSIVWSLDTEQAERIEQLDDATFCYELERAIEGRFGAVKLMSQRLSFPLSQRHAQIYGIAGLLLVGDAAHSIHPLAGLGANLGFQDVVALCREIRRAHQRGISFGHESIIGRYQRARKLDNELTLQAMKLFKMSFADQGMLLNTLRNQGLKLFSSLKPLKKIVAGHALMTKA